MLVLGRKEQESFTIGDGIVVSILKIRGNSVQVGIEAPREIPVVRCEIEPYNRKNTTDKKGK
jgi:carbon storage regulator